MSTPQKGWGLIQSAIRDVSEYVLGRGNVPYIYFNEKADWRDWGPNYESQSMATGEETHGCTLWGAQNQIETLDRYFWNDRTDYSEAFNYPRVPIRPENGGADPHDTYENIRRDGMVSERDFPMPRTLAQLKDRSRTSKSLEARALRWVSRNDFRHEWLWTPGRRPATYKEIIKDALKTSPLGISVSAWASNGEVYVSDGFNRNNHWCVLLYVGDYLTYKDAYYVLDTYDHSHKWLHPDHDIRMSKRIWLQRRTVREMRTFIRVLQDVVRRLSMKPTLADIARANLGVDVSPRDLAPDDLSCAESVSTLMKQLDPKTPIMTGTWTLWVYLGKPENGWVSVPEYEEGAIVISPTGTGSGTGHVGICTGNGLIASTNSFGALKGIFTENYTVEAWKRQFVDKQRMIMSYYKKV